MREDYNCVCMDICSDIARMRAADRARRPDEELIEQCFELCSVGGSGCSKRDAYLEARKTAGVRS